MSISKHEDLKEEVAARYLVFHRVCWVVIAEPHPNMALPTMASRWSTAERTPPTWRWMESTKQKHSTWWFGGINKDVWCVRQMCAPIVPVGADKHDLKLLTRFFDGSIRFHQDPCQTATRRALIKKKESKREEGREWVNRHRHKYYGCWRSFHCFGYFQTLSLSSTSPNTSSSSPNGFFQIQPGSLLTTNPAVILHLGRVCAALWLCVRVYVCVFWEPPLSPGRGSGGMAGIKMTSECHGSRKENRPVLTSNSSLSCSLSTFPTAEVHSIIKYKHRIFTYYQMGLRTSVTLKHSGETFPRYICADFRH